MVAKKAKISQKMKKKTKQKLVEYRKNYYKMRKSALL